MVCLERKVAVDKYKWRNIRRARSLEDRLYILLGDDWCGNSGPPGQNVSIRTKGSEQGVQHVFSWGGNDGFDLGIGYPDQWLVHINRREAAWLWWAITLRAFSTWFGLRRWVWYRLLFRRVRVNRQHGVHQDA